MIILDKVFEIYRKYSVCPHCLGRMFSLLGTETTNIERGESLLLTSTLECHRLYLSGEQEIKENAIKNLQNLAFNANFSQAQKVLEKEGLISANKEFNYSCYLCNNIFFDLTKFIDKAEKIVENIEFHNFLVGCRPDSLIVNREDKFKAEFNLLEAESFKGHFNREVGKKLTEKFNIEVEFNNPEIVFLYSISFNSFDLNLIIKSIYISGRYKKLVRGIPQTHWICQACRGKGCVLCNNTGKKYNISVEELISPEFVKEAQASNSKFHGAGREDIDVRMMGSGRPFILELKEPKIRTFDLNKLAKRVNKKCKRKIEISNLKYSNKKEVIRSKAEAENAKKTYKALVESEQTLNKLQFKNKLEQLKIKLENKKIHQRTPLRVSHRRADKIRKKYIYRIEGKYIKSNLFEFTIETQGGTYIKELINGDNGRTKSSFTEIFGFALKCKNLDVINIEYS
ncbi:MAG: tRNA pseudouridine(54/55) synthase Pus10 [Promethearchaeota archaeon]